jgi:hypothetical protein
MAIVQLVKVDMTDLKRFAFNAHEVMQTYPQLILEDVKDDEISFQQMLLNPIVEYTKSKMGNKICKVESAYCFGLNDDEENDLIAGIGSTTFTGSVYDVTLTPTIGDHSPEIQLNGPDSPALVFETNNDDMKYNSIAQTYLHIGVPLLGNVIKVNELKLVI